MARRTRVGGVSLHGPWRSLQNLPCLPWTVALIEQLPLLCCFLTGLCRSFPTYETLGNEEEKEATFVKDRVYSHQ